MAFIDLPQELNGFSARRADGRIVRFEFRVFAGEVISAQAASSRDGASRRGPAQRLRVRSADAERAFAFHGLPKIFAPGDAAAVIAVLSERDKNGPIVGLGNLDAGERVDFRWRESEILQLLSGENADYRKPATRRRALAIAVLKGLGLGLAAFLALRALAAGQGLDPAAFDPTAFESGALEAAMTASLRQSALAAGAVGALGALYGAVRQARRAARKAANQARALRRFWERVGETLGHVADHKERYRPRPAETPQIAPAPLTAPTRLLPPPLERPGARREAFKPSLAARKGVAAKAKAATIGDAVRALESAARRRRAEEEHDPFFATYERRRADIRRRAEEKWRETERQRRLAEREDALRARGGRRRPEAPESPAPEPRREPGFEGEGVAPKRPGRAPSFFEPGFSTDRGRLPGRSGRRFN